MCVLKKKKNYTVKTFVSSCDALKIDSHASKICSVAFLATNAAMPQLQNVRLQIPAIPRLISATYENT